MALVSGFFVADAFNIGCPADEEFSLAVATSVLAVENKYTVVASRSPSFLQLSITLTFRKPTL